MHTGCDSVDFHSIHSHHICAWLRGNKFFLKSRIYIEYEGYYLKSAWLSFDTCIGLHEAADFPLIPFDEARERCWAYLNDACRVLGRPEGSPGWSLEADEAKAVIDQLGPPPVASYSIYMMTIQPPEGDEKAVYVGQTNSKKHRFSGGHSALSKLHHPKYDGCKKRIYFGCVLAVNDDDNIIPVEWLPNEFDRSEIITSIEYEIIYALKPELNTAGVNKNLARNSIPITIQNLTSPGFLDANSFGPDEDFDEFWKILQHDFK